MAACTRCGFQQNGTQIYCERCGMFMPALAIYNPGQTEYSVPPQVVTPPLIKQRFLGEGDLTPQMVLNRCIREGIAIIGLFVAAFGLFGFFQNIVGAGWALLLGFILLIGGVIAISLLFFIRKLLPRLRWPHIVVGGIGATIVCFVIIITLSGIVQNSTLGKDFGYGITLFLYGLVIVVLAIW